MAALGLLCAAGVGFGCSSSTNNQSSSSGGATQSSTGGSSGSGGSGGASSTSATGGSTDHATGGASAAGGTTDHATGGASAAGGTTDHATGGASAAGGTTDHATGGASAAGGSASGGVSAPGGSASGGASANSGTGGNSGGAGGSPNPDAGGKDSPPAADSSNDLAVDRGSDGGATTQHTCNLIIGGSLAGEWFAAGFETFVDNARWEIIPKSEAYTNLWADPKNADWSTAIVSPCTTGSTNPDRVIFIGFNWTYTTAAEWQADLEKIITNIQTKYSNVKRIDLMTMIRSPNNQTCGQATGEDIVQPFVDDAIASVVAAPHTAQVTAAPKFYVPDCATFGPTTSPHFTPAGNTAMAKIIGAYYATDQ
jgi:hypothetical protein